jgi:hypothetical protein
MNDFQDREMQQKKDAKTKNEYDVVCFVEKDKSDVPLDMMLGTVPYGINRYTGLPADIEIRYTETEGKALTASFSHRFRSRCKYLPALKRFSKVRCTIRTSLLQVPAFVLSSKGIPLSQN